MVNEHLAVDLVIDSRTTPGQILHLPIYLKVQVLVAQLCLTLCNPMDCSPRGSSVHGILQARTLEPFPFQGNLPTQGLNPGLLHRRQILYHRSHQGGHKWIASVGL